MTRTAELETEARDLKRARSDMQESFSIVRSRAIDALERILATRDVGEIHEIAREALSGIRRPVR